MAKLLDLRPVFSIEWRAAARRWQVYAMRSLFVVGLLAGLACGFWVEQQEKASARARAQAGFWFFAAISCTQLALVLLLAPAATSGSICLDSARGSLAHALATDLRSAEIVLAKLAARLVPVLGLLACGVPVMILAAFLGGVDPDAFLAGTMLVAATAVLGCSLGLVFSVWATRMDEALLASYAVLVAWIAAYPAWLFFNRIGWLRYGPPQVLTGSNPVFLIASQVWTPGKVGWPEVWRLVAGLLLVSVVLIALAIATLRPVAARRPSGTRRRLRRSIVSRWLAPSLDRNPMLWREWQRKRATGWIGKLWFLYDLCALAATGTIITLVIERGLGISTQIASLLNGLQVAAGMLLLIVSSTMALAEERARGGLDVLLATPLESRSIVLAQWWGTFRVAIRLSLLPTVAAFAIACRSGRYDGVAWITGLVLSYGAFLVSLGLALAIWVGHPGRAATLGVAAHVVATVGWFFLVVFLFPGARGATGPGIASGSPFIAVSFATIAMQNGVREWAALPRWWSFWMALELGLSGILLAAAVASFDHCVGRAAPTRRG
jgi:hypothetical protein